MLFIGAYQIFDAMFLIYVGALRGAGDTLVPAQSFSDPPLPPNTTRVPIEIE